MLNFLETWFVWLTIAAIPGLINLLVAYMELETQCRALTFFEPYKNPGFWLWGVLQFLFPSAMFWYDSNLTSQPGDYDKLVIKAIVFGLSFVTIFNAQAKIGDQIYNIKARTYQLLVGIAYQSIAANQTQKAARFWSDVERALEQSKPNLEEGLRYLSNYFQLDITLDPDLKTKLEAQIDKAKAASQKTEIVKGLLQKLRRAHLLEALDRFGCSDLKQQYISHFPPQLAGKIP